MEKSIKVPQNFKSRRIIWSNHFFLGIYQKKTKNTNLKRWLSGVESACNTGDSGDAGLIPGSGSSPSWKWQPTPIFLLGKSHEQRSLVGYSLWGLK